MNKREIFMQHCLVPTEDGTFLDLHEQYMLHPQKNPEILKRACYEMSQFVHFCMDIVVYYWSPQHERYLQATEDADLEKWEVNLDTYPVIGNLITPKRVIIRPDTPLEGVEYENLQGLIQMFVLHESYYQIFKRLLRGETFLEQNKKERR